MSRLRRFLKWLYCDILGLHGGHVECYNGWTFLECHRCGELTSPAPPSVSIALARSEGYDDFADELEDLFG